MKVNTKKHSAAFHKRKLEILYSMLLTAKKLEDNIGQFESVLGVKKLHLHNLK